MSTTIRQRDGIVLAVLAVIIWSGNFIVARGVIARVPPITLNFYRWAIASLFIIPFAFSSLRKETEIILASRTYFFVLSLTGIALFNSFIYLAGHYTSAINLALIGTTSSPIFANILAAVFLKERLRLLRIAGMLCCLLGIVILISQGSLDRLRAFSFNEGDWWVLLAGFFFAVYNTLVKVKPVGVSQVSFLATSFILGTLILLPGYLYELSSAASVVWDFKLISIFAYLGIGASLLAYFFWNKAIAVLGSARTSIFGNLIPFFSTLEAVLILDEKITWLHFSSGLLIIAGLVMANMNAANSPATASSR